MGNISQPAAHFHPLPPAVVSAVRVITAAKAAVGNAVSPAAKAAALDRLYSGAAERDGVEILETSDAAGPGFASLAARRSEPPARAPAAFDPAPDIAFLKRLKKIRVVFTHAPGLGHQTATLSIVRRLRDLGVKAPIEAIYHAVKGDPQDLRLKLAQLMPEFDPHGPDDQRVPSLNMTLRSWDSFRRDRDDVVLGLTGGADKSIGNFARQYRTEIFARLKPYGWGDYEDELHVLESGKVSLLSYIDASSGHGAFVYRPAQDQVGAAYVDALNPNNVPAAKAAGLKVLLRELPKRDSLAAYGLHFFTPRALHRLLLGVSRALDDRPGLFKGRGVVVPLLLDIDDTVDDMQDQIKIPRLILNSVTDPRWRAVLVANGKLRRRLKIADIRDPALSEKIEGMKPDDILVVKTGAVPPPLFEWFFSRSTLPPTLEGKNATNLAHLLGIPFLPIKEDVLAGLIDRVPEGGPREAVAALLHVRTGVIGMSISAVLHHDDFSFAFEKLADYMIAAMTPGSPLREMFRSARIAQDDYARDKLLQAVRQARPRMGAPPSPWRRFLDACLRWLPGRSKEKPAPPPASQGRQGPTGRERVSFFGPKDPL